MYNRKHTFTCESAFGHFVLYMLHHILQFVLCISTNCYYTNCYYSTLNLCYGKQESGTLTIPILGLILAGLILAIFFAMHKITR